MAAAASKLLRREVLSPSRVRSARVQPENLVIQGAASGARHPFPTVVFVIVEELIPLQKPEDGWVRNYGFWIRTAILVFVVGHTNSGQARYLVDAVDLSERQVVLLCAWTTVIFTMFAVLVASQITFPVPFFVITMAPMFSCS